ncbi:DUF4352 domain-containing protein [Nakamurella sp. GG22]
MITTPVAPPGGSGVGSVVPEVTLSTEKPIPMASTADFGDVSAAITTVSAVTATGVGPGQITGPAVAVTVKITNDSAEAVSLDSVFVNLNDSTGAPGQPSTSSPAAPLTGELAPGATAQGVYVFGVPESARKPVTILVSNTMAAKVVSFVGDAR